MDPSDADHTKFPVDAVGSGLGPAHSVSSEVGAGTHPAVAEVKPATEPAVAAAPVEADVAESTPPAPPSVAAAEPTAKSKPRTVKSRLARFELPILIVVAVAVAILLKTFVLQPFYIPSQSMEKTLYGCPGCSGDRILVFKPVYRVRAPHPGDIVVFKAPVDWNEGGGVSLSANPVIHGVQWFGQLVGVVPPSEKDLVKRVIAVGGQTVQCCDDNGNVQISDTGPKGPWRSLDEPYIFEPSPWSKPPAPGVKAPGDSRSFGPVTVPQGRLWVMGDHRSDSADSRYHCGAGGVGPNCDATQSTVAVSDVIGKAVVIAWPPSRWRTLGTPKTFSALGVPGMMAAATEPVPAAAIGFGGLFLLRRWTRRRQDR
jgi:signal peptidase I